MCRYSSFDHSYKDRYACFNCCKAFKESKPNIELKSCPNCKGQVYWVGKDFKPPRKEAKNDWKKLALITIDNEGRWGSCGCDGPGYVPTNSEVAQKDSRSKNKWNKQEQKRYK
jgi:hypothetical protein